jgi:hypothetical protein
MTLVAPTAPLTVTSKGSGAGDPDAPAFQCAAYTSQKPRWDLCRDLRAGADVMRGRGKVYLPQEQMETDPEYLKRLSRAPFFNGYARTTSGLVGMVFRKPPVISDDAPPDFTKDWENIDGEGTAGAVFCAEVFEEAMAEGHTFILVDYPSIADPKQVDASQERSLGLRPYWIHVRQDQVVNWRTRNENGVAVLAQVCIEEHTLEVKGMFGEEAACRYRVFRNDAGVVTWQLWTESKDGSTTKYSVTEEGTLQGPKVIPLVCVIAGPRLGYFCTKPPLLDLAFSNISHYQVGADRRHALHLSSQPMLVRIGCEADTPFQAVGSNVGFNVPQGGDGKWIEPTGSGLAALKAELDDLKSEMAAQGLGMLVRETRQAETAEAKRMDKSEQDSPLSRAAKNCQDALNQCVMLHQAYRRATPVPTITLNVEFEALTLDAATIDAYGRMVDAKRLSLTTFWDIMKKGGSLTEDFDPKKELEKIAEESLTVLGGDTEPEPPDPDTNDPPTPQPRAA